MDEKTRKIRNGVIRDCFIDPADKDYILARYASRLGLIDQFLWLSLQALERYFKAILLYHDEDTRRLSHDLNKAIRRINELNAISIAFTPASRRLVEVLTTLGRDRYFTVPRRTEGLELLVLDHTVWNIRRYCQDIQFLDLFHPSGIGYTSQEYLKLLASLAGEKCIHFRPSINRGHLDDVLDTEKFLDQRRVLVWRNFCFGLRRKGRIRVGGNWSFTFRKPTHFCYPGIIQWAKERIQLDNEVIKYLESLNGRV